MFRTYVYMRIIEETFNCENILKTKGQISRNRTYGPDFIHQQLLEDIEICKLFANKTNHILKKNKWRIPEELRVSRLLILTKTSIPVASVSQTRPIAVQSLPIKIIEKIIKQNLDNCQLCKSTELPINQTGFQPNMSAMINLIRVKSVINKNRKRSKNKKFIFSSI